MRATIWYLVFWGLNLLENIYDPLEIELSDGGKMVLILIWFIPFALLLKKDLEDK